MEYSQEIDDKRKIVCTKTKGALNPREVGPLVIETRIKAKELNYKLLFDFSDSTNLISITDAYNWLPDQYDRIDPKLKLIPSAHIINEETEDFFSFVELAWNNRGARIKLFSDKKSAIKWLESLK